MKPPKRKRVSETFETTLRRTIVGTLCPRWEDISVTDRSFNEGDRVRVKVTKLERGK